MEVKRICQWCGKPFIAQKTTTCYCSHQCSNLGYKERIRERKRQLKRSQELLQPRQAAEGQDFFSFAQAAKLMGVTRQYIYKLVKESKLRASRISGKKSLICRADIELMMKTKPYERVVPKEDFNISEYYTAEEIAEKYKVNAKWVWTYTRQHKVPKVRIRQFNYYSKKHIDAAFAKYEVDSDLTEWYTPEEIQEKYGMTRVAIRSQVYRNNIPSKKEHGQIFCSKLHFDLSKSSEQESKAEYYSDKEAMEIFQNYFDIPELDKTKFARYAKQFARGYDDEAAVTVLRSMKYKKRSIAFMKKVLDTYKVPNTLSQFLSNASHYKGPTFNKLAR